MGRIDISDITNFTYSSLKVCCTLYSRGSRFLDFWIFNFLQFAIYGENNSKTKL
jgi:hypothetical protein